MCVCDFYNDDLGCDDERPFSCILIFMVKCLLRREFALAVLFANFVWDREGEREGGSERKIINETKNIVAYCTCRI